MTVILWLLFSIFPRRHSIFLFEASVEIGKIVKPAGRGNGQDIIISSLQHSCSNLQPIIVQIGNEADAHALLEKFHKIRFAVKAKLCHILNADLLCIVHIHIGQNCFDFVRVLFCEGRGRRCIFCHQQMNDLVQIAFYCKLISGMPFITQLVNVLYICFQLVIVTNNRRYC